MLRYVILKHDWDGVHYDLMLEREGMLDTWRMQTNLETGQHHVKQLPVHRLDYLTYEGSVSGNRGIVKRVAFGVYTVLERREGSLRLELNGECTGCMTLVHLDGLNWQLEWQTG